MIFEWDENKNKANIKKHGISFQTARHVFEDVFCIIDYDDDNSIDEERFIALGEVSGEYYLLSVAFTDRGDAIRIISARRANKSERREYYDR